MNDTTNEMLLRVYRSLDFETTPRYTLTIKAAVGVILFSETSISLVLVSRISFQTSQGYVLLVNIF